jgi:hypothetical protein
MSTTPPPAPLARRRWLQVSLRTLMVLVRGTSRRRFQYGLRSLLLVVAAIAAVLGVVGFQIRGRVQVGFERPFFTHFPTSQNGAVSARSAANGLRFEPQRS